MSESLLSLRPALSSHIPALLGLLEKLFKLESDFTFDAPKAERGLRLLLGRDDALLLVAEAESQAIGMCSVQTLISTAEGGAVGLLEDLVVTEDWRGLGVGRRLLATAETWAGERGLTRLQLLADLDNRPALDFYSLLGWRETRLACRRRML